MIQRWKSLNAPALVSCLGVAAALIAGSWRGPSCQAAEAQLTVLRRAIDPPRLVVQRLDAAGDYEILEIVPPERILRVARGQRGSAASWLDALVASGYFSWPDSALVPPPTLDVDSDPVRVELRTQDAIRVLSTRAPHVPPPLQVVLDSLATLDAVAVPVESCVVCVFRSAGNTRVRAPENLPGVVLRELKASEEGPFPVVLSRAAGRSLLQEKRMAFDWPSARGRFRVVCRQWNP